MSILNRWKQFSHRYFWSHFLLGAVTASVGVSSYLILAVEPIRLPVVNINISIPLFNYSGVAVCGGRAKQNSSCLRVNDLVLQQQKTAKQFLTNLMFVITPSFSTNGCCLNNSFVFASNWQHQDDSLLLMDCFFDDHLFYLLASQSSRLVKNVISIEFPPFIEYQIGLWLASIGSIRADPPLVIY